MEEFKFFFQIGMIKNYARQIERFPKKAKLSRKLLTDICVGNEKIVLKIAPVYLQAPEFIWNYLDKSRSALSKIAWRKLLPTPTSLLSLTPRTKTPERLPGTE